MDWITLLRSLQSDFIKRLSSGCLLHCEIEGQYSELTVISGERLKTLRDFCWLMAEKYKRVSPVRDVFISYLKGKLGEEVVKERLADLITEVDYEKRLGGDGKIDFTLTANPAIGIEVKSRHGNIDRVRWSVSAEEVEKNAVVVCIFIKEDVNEAQSSYHLLLAGFLPTQMIKLKTGNISFGIEQLLYGGGLWGYLEQLQASSNYHQFQQSPPIYEYQPQPEFSTKINQSQSIKPALFTGIKNILSYRREEDINIDYIKLGDECFAQGEYTASIKNYSQALQASSNNGELYYKRGLTYYQLGDYEAAIADYSQAINLNFHDAKSYHKRGLALSQLAAYEAAIDDYNQAIRINPHAASIYKNRAEARSHLGDNQGAIEDYTQAIKINPQYADTYKNRGISRYLLATQPGFTQAIKINPNDANAYKNRGNARADIGDYAGAIEDYNQAIQINPKAADAYYNRGNARYDLGDEEGAIADYTQAIQINPSYADAYYNRGNVRAGIKDKQGAIADFQKAADIYRKEGKLAELKDATERIVELEIEESIDILNF
ncbi:TPR repeat protein [Trichormus variabilis ATCC 29413]|uniref:TPR repeat protein n=2 Tax=Anabaena variabilis TaxID=264691 RepID=Q3M4D4_TRIV2|nr:MULTISPECIES: tetratricopeptide repeat protein [Nostocaceae]ABA24152.1 TPR repeat protein [Trichormus variabilis ATCC 29413]MBC1215407.1 tetratricopeptide repeat protein [Trichormus variabilis ARAD]MBC1255003.1 tetratricopeptide repeat protein [Trichormus variabilis V5]MBC1266249.1 tetratricopeptide repeat protein [Trichormus variabilis FSR]MBC1301988.1 tetratricopeptide repeat protein [Trichormus variabilis N2B]